jgi:RNA polymerase sigma-70 factor (ECF subfamily)
VLSVVPGARPDHTGHMTGNAPETTFVTGAAGFIGTELVKVLGAHGHQVLGLAEGQEAAQRVRRAGAVPCSKTSGCAGSVSALATQRSNRDSSKCSERSMSEKCCRPATTPATGESFEEVVLPHLDAAFRLARWLIRNEHDAEDVVQEASLRAFRYFRTFTGGSGRAWFLRIVRNCCRDRRGHRFQALTDPFDEEQHRSAEPASDPETLLLRTDDVALVERTMSHLPARFHELLVLRELEGLSYRELAVAMDMPIGTVMSSLSRARQAFRGALTSERKEFGIPTRAHLREREADAVLV